MNKGLLSIACAFVYASLIGGAAFLCAYKDWSGLTILGACLLAQLIVDEIK